MTCGEAITPTSTVFRGLCERHALELAATLPIELHDKNLYGERSFVPPQYEDGDEVYRPADFGFEEAIDALNAQERCADCPTFVGAELYEVDRTTWYLGTLGRLGTDCKEEALAAAEALHPRWLPQVHAGDSRESGHIFWVFAHARMLFENLRAVVFNSWPTCENCPIPQAPVLAKVDQRLDTEILNALALHGTLNTSDLVAAVKKLTNGIARKVLEKMVDDGRIVLERRGTAKFYSLPS